MKFFVQVGSREVYWWKVYEYSCALVQIFRTGYQLIFSFVDFRYLAVISFLRCTR